MTSVVVIGGSLAGLRAAEVMREDGFDGTITIVGAEPHLPYNRPPLSKQFLAAEWDEERIALRSQDQLNALNLDIRTGVHAVNLDVDRRVIQLSDGTDIAFDGAVIATGTHNRSLPALEGKLGVFSLRTLDDSRELREALAGAKSMLVVGGGFIGSEVAVTAHAQGIDVCIVEPQETLMFRGLGTVIGNALTDLHRAQGIDVRCNTSISNVSVDGERTTLELTDGSVHTPDLIVVGIGAIPTTDWLSQSNLKCDNGVVTDEFCRAIHKNGSPATAIVAAGDVARWFSHRQQQHVRSEHWTNAQDQAASAARTLLADLNGRTEEAPVYDPVPYVWSDQYGKKIQVVGHVEPTDTAHVVKGSLEDSKFLALMERDGQFVGAIGMAMVPAVVQARSLLNDRVSLKEAQEQLAS